MQKVYKGKFNQERSTDPRPVAWLKFVLYGCVGELSGEGAEPAAKPKPKVAAARTKTPKDAPTKAPDNDGDRIQFFVISKDLTTTIRAKCYPSSTVENVIRVLQGSKDVFKDSTII